MTFNLFKIINIKVFLLALFIGLIYVYIDSSKEKITVYPTPSNIKNVQYKDKADNCYTYELQNISCPSDKSKIKEIPIQ